MTPYYQDDSVTIYHGDCVEVMAAMPDNSVDAIVTDPPYFRVKADAWDRQWDKPEGFLAWLDTVAAQWHRLLALAALYRLRREHIEACMSCTSGMNIVATNESIQTCMDCPILAAITKDLERQAAARQRRG